MSWLKPYMPAYLRFAIPAWICLLGEVLIDLSLPTLMARIVNIGIYGNDTDYVLRMGFRMLGLALVGSLFGMGRNWLSTHASQDLGTKLRADLFRKTQQLSLASARQFGTASLITRLTNDVMQVQNLSFMLTRIFIRAPLMLIGGIVMAFTVNRQMAMILVAVLPVLALLIGYRLKRGFPLFKKVQKAIDGVNSVLREYLSGVRVVKVFNRFDFERDRFETANEELAQRGVSAARSMATIQPLIFLLMNGSIVLILWVGGLRVSDGQAQVGDIMAFVTYFLLILQAMGILSMIFMAGVRARTSLDRVSQVFLINDELPHEDDQTAESQAGSLGMEHVYYTYEGQKKPVLKDICFQIQGGQTAALIGSTGSGKSTLIGLLPRFYDVDSGQILVDGISVKKQKKDKLRNKMAVVPQKSILFTGTVEENMRWGNPRASLQDIEEALDIAQAKEFVMNMPHGLQTMIGQGGVNLSGGQKQRLCIARAILRKAPILILDDSTSAIDMTTERRLREALAAHSREQTVLLIAQRIHSVMDADLIMVMDNGSLVDQGSHDELLRRCTIYQEIFRSQMGLDASGKEVV